MRPRRLLCLFVCVVCAALVAACGRSTDLQVRATDFHFSPQRWTVPAGETITVTLANEGLLAHAWIVMQAGETATPPFGDDDRARIYWEIEAGPRETVSGTFVAPDAPGEYQVVCGIVGHLEQHMTGTLIVR